MVKCPHCGKLFAAEELVRGLVPSHDYPEPCRSSCPGSKQNPRAADDTAPLWCGAQTAQTETAVISRAAITRELRDVTDSDQ